MPRLTRSWLSRPLTRLLVCVLVMGAVVAQDGSVPHVHAAWASGLYNHEHDLTNAATVGAGAPLPATTPAAPLQVADDRATAVVATAPSRAPLRHRDSRAPPAR